MIRSMDDLKPLLRRIDPAVLGGRIREQRVALGLKQSEVVDGLASVPYLSRIESGQRKPDIDLLAGLATRLSTTADALLAGVSDDARAADRLQLDYAEMALRSDNPGRSVELARDLVARYEKSIDLDLLTSARIVLAAGLEATSDLDGAIDVLEAVIGADNPDDLAVARAGTALVRCYRDSGDFSRAISAGEAVLERLQVARLGTSDEALELLATIASAYFERGEAAHAVRLLKRGAVEADATGSPAALAAIYWNAAVIQSERGDSAGALPLADKALALLRQADRAASLPRLRAQIASMQLDLDPPPLAEVLPELEAVATEFAATGAPWMDQARVAIHTARAHLLGGDLAAAESHARRALDMTTDAAPTLSAEALAILGRTALSTSGPDAARRFFVDAALTLARAEYNHDRQTARLWFNLADLLESVGAAQEALDAYRRGAAATGHVIRQDTISRAIEH